MSLPRRMPGMGLLLILVVLFAAALDAGERQSNLGIGRRLPAINRTRATESGFHLNRGESSPAVKFYAFTARGLIGVTHEGEIRYRLPQLPETARDPGSLSMANRQVLRERFVKGRISRVLGLGRIVSRASYYRESGNPAGKVGALAYSIVDLGEVYPGIEIKLQSFGTRLEKLFCVNPGGEVNEIRIRLVGSESLRIDRGGELVAASGESEIVFSRPKAFQVINGRYRPVSISFSVKGKTYGFRVGEYDRDFALIIDPASIGRPSDLP